ncbi:hypothetical protein AVEN_64289-1 [Araneus ventricosus]|uniref:Uncharacterized protein n=1 Tax=Araneus ventricosus TaxID=182803 RepID=A0A4Y2GE91_ARAVE|nr:hypothetical protein AVEN_64289-1 [Araneus ventricosus]
MLQRWLFPQIQPNRDDFIFMKDGAPPDFHHEKDMMAWWQHLGLKRKELQVCSVVSNSLVHYATARVKRPPAGVGGKFEEGVAGSCLLHRSAVRGFNPKRNLRVVSKLDVNLT